jgi:hypothetical protein
VLRALRAHLDEHPIQQLDLVVLAEDPRIDHRDESDASTWTAMTAIVPPSERADQRVERPLTRRP